MGWPSLFAAVAILGGVQLIATSVIGEYIARIYVQAQARPLYNIAERLNFDEHQAPDELQRASLVPVPASAPGSAPLATPAPATATATGPVAGAAVEAGSPGPRLAKEGAS
jgi:hypothetical protein